MRILIAGGGTAGHVFPAIAVARRLVDDHGVDVEFLGTAAGQESKLVPAAGFGLIEMEAKPLLRKASLATLRAPFVAFGSMRRCGPLVRKADAVLGMGGYVSAPPVVAAWRSGTPVVLHEQNAIPGLANKLCSRVARTTAVAFAEAESALPRRAHAVVTGNPIREEIAAVSGRSAAPGEGGARGARPRPRAPDGRGLRREPGRAARRPRGGRGVQPCSANAATSRCCCSTGAGAPRGDRTWPRRPRAALVVRRAAVPRPHGARVRRRRPRRRPGRRDHHRRAVGVRRPVRCWSRTRTPRRTTRRRTPARCSARAARACCRTTELSAETPGGTDRGPRRPTTNGAAADGGAATAWAAARRGLRLADLVVEAADERRDRPRHRLAVPPREASRRSPVPDLGGRAAGAHDRHRRRRDARICPAPARPRHRGAGSDLKESAGLDDLAAQGAVVAVGHVPSRSRDGAPDAVVISTAIPERNPELAEARRPASPSWPAPRCWRR